MKTVLLGTLAAALVASPIAASADAQAYQQRETTTVRHYPGRTVVTQRDVVRGAPRAWHRGERFDHRYAPNYGVIDYRPYRGRHLYAPPRGYHWVRSGNDAVLVGVTTGIVAATLAGALR